MKRSMTPTIITLLLLAALVIASEGAVNGAKAALSTCSHLLIPCLFPFFTVSLLINRLGLPLWLGTKLQGPMALLFGVSGTGAGVFLLGILGGYPIGAAVIADLLQRGELKTEEANRLLTFCNNSGPSFLIGAVGVGVFHSSAVGLLLYGVHILSAVITGMFLSGRQMPPAPQSKVLLHTESLGVILPDAIGKAALQMVQICGYAVFFGAVLGVLEESGLISTLCGTLAVYTPLTLHHARALCTGILELGCGMGAMEGAALTPQALTLCSLLTGFGGVSVCLQTAGVLQGTNLSVRRHLLGRLCCSATGAFIMYTLSSMVL